MKIKFLLVYFLFLFILVNDQPFTAAQGDSSDSPKESISSQQAHRGDFLKELETAEEEYLKNPADKKSTFNYAKKLFEVGNFNKSQEILSSLTYGVTSPIEVDYLLGKIAYLKGDYSRAENLFGFVASKASGPLLMDAQYNLALTYYQTKQYHKADRLTQKLPQADDLRKTMQAFGNREPLKIHWEGKNKAIIPFLSRDPLPIIPVEINGKKLNLLIDTGGSTLNLDEDIAKSLGIAPVSSGIGQYAGGKELEVHTGIADSLQLGDIKMTSIPVGLSPIEWDQVDLKTSEVIPIHGILGTNIFQQFLTTMDYPNEQLILRPRTMEGHALLKQDLMQDRSIVEMPFTMAETHLLIGKGSLNGKTDLNFLLDSGLSDPEETSGFLIPDETLQYLGIPMPEAELNTSSEGLAGSGFYVGRLTLDSLKLGDLKEEKQIVALTGVIPQAIYFDAGGFLIDGLVSHLLLRKYKWTIDFDSMKMTFSK